MSRKSIVIIVSTLLIITFGYLVSNSCLRTSSRQAANTKQDEGKNAFGDFFGQKKRLPQKNKEVTLIAVGDISYSRGVSRIVKKRNDINYPFLKIHDYLKSADIVFGNLDTPITEGREIANFEKTFRSNPGTELALKNAGFSWYPWQTTIPLISVKNGYPTHFVISRTLELPMQAQGKIRRMRINLHILNQTG